MSKITFNTAVTAAVLETDHGKWLHFWCDACKHLHAVPFVLAGVGGYLWQYDGNLESPSISPSLRIGYTDPNTHAQKTTCHSFLTNGVIEYLHDCGHTLRGKHPLVRIPVGYAVGGHPAP